jgi:hypothetical protein
MRVHVAIRSAVALALTALAMSALGCNYLLDTSAYHVTADAGVDAAPVVDASSVVDACSPGTNRVSLENACTGAACTPYTGSVPTCDGGLCALPPPDASATTTDAQAAVDATADAGEGGASSVDASGSADATVDATSEDGAAGDATLADAGAADTGASPGTDGGGGSDAAPPAVDAGADAGPVSCSMVRSDSNSIIFVTGSTALSSFIGEVSKVLATQPTNPVTVVYQASGSCVGVHSAIDPVNNPLLQTLGASTYYDSSGTQHSCTISASDDLVADIGASDVFYSTCYIGQAVTPQLPQSVAENLGPVQVMNFAVPQGSTQKSISLAAAYYVFGFGGVTYPIAPWTNPLALQIRSAASGTQSMISAAIGVPPARWHGVGNSTSSGVGNALIAAGQSSNQAVIDSALGILASDYLLQNSNTLRGLAVQDENSTCGYYPSSTGTAHDGANVRNGHYPLWGPSHFYARVDPQRQIPLKAGVSQFIDGVSGVTALPGLDLVGEYAAKGLVPLCAMGVNRSDDGGDYTPFKAPKTCNCYFDLIATGATSCTPCNTNNDCTSDAPSCNQYGPAPQQGYCDR